MNTISHNLHKTSEPIISYNIIEFDTNVGRLAAMERKKNLIMQKPQRTKNPQRENKPSDPDDEKQ